MIEQIISDGIRISKSKIDNLEEQYVWIKLTKDTTSSLMSSQDSNLLYDKAEPIINRKIVYKLGKCF